MSFDTFLSDVVATVVGGAVITFLLFLIKERVLPIAKVSGVWEVTTETAKSLRPEFEGMKLTYRIVLWQSGAVVGGTAEKVREEVRGGSPHDYRGPDRIRSRLEGSIQKNYLSKDVINMHMTEYGANRESTTYFRLRCDKPKICQGEYASTAADSSGTTEWKRIT